jgi:Polyketide cyclase / dehydrase and lipid transport
MASPRLASHCLGRGELHDRGDQAEVIVVHALSRTARRRTLRARVGEQPGQGCRDAGPWRALPGMTDGLRFLRITQTWGGATMPSASHSVVINRPASEVFAFVADGENAPRWRTGVLDIQRESGQGVGAV